MSDTSTTSVTCNHCGAPLEIQPSTRFVNCTYCGARLEVHRSGNALYTEVLDSIDQRTREIAEDVDAIRRQNELERLDREWQIRREELMVRGKRGGGGGGGAHPPSAAGGVIGAVVAVVFGIFWTVMAASSGAPAFFPIFGVIFILVGLFGGIASIVKASEYSAAKQRYERERVRLLRGDGKDPSR